MCNYSQISVDIQEDADHYDWVSTTKEGFNITLIDFNCYSDRVRVESGDGETFAFEMDKRAAIHLAKMILCHYENLNE